MNAQNKIRHTDDHDPIGDHERAKYHLHRKQRATPRPEAECVTESIFDLLDMPEPKHQERGTPLPLAPVENWPDADDFKSRRGRH